MTDSCAPTLEMLWETCDPTTVLAERFGFGDASEAGRWIGEVLAELWDIRVQSCDRIVTSDRSCLAWIDTSRGRLLAKWSVATERFSRLSEIARLTSWLEQRGLPVSAPTPALDGSLQVQTGGASVGLQRVIAGELLDVAIAGQVREAGVALARLHTALAEYPSADQVAPAPSSGAALAEEIGSWLDSPAAGLTPVARDSLRRRADAAPRDPLPMQVVHGDFRSANVICSGGEIAAVLDFEEARIDHRVVELARSAAMLGTRFQSWRPAPLDVQAAFLSAYQSVCALTAVEAAWLGVLVPWQSLVIAPFTDDPAAWTRSALEQMDEWTGDDAESG